MIKILLFLGLVVSVSIASASGQQLESAMQPRIMIYYYDPMPSRHGSLIWDCPVFAAYSNGSVIWRKRWKDSLDSLFITHSRDAEEIVQKIEAIVARYGEQTFVLTGSSDPKQTILEINGKALTVLGDWQKPRVLEVTAYNDPKLISQINEHEHELWSALPDDLRKALAAIIDFDSPEKSLWRPQKLLLLLDPPLNLQREYINWPTNWPRSFAPVVNNSNMKWIELPGSMLDELLKTIPDRGQPKPIKFENEIRYPKLSIIFPGIKLNFGAKP